MSGCLINNLLRIFALVLVAVYVTDGLSTLFQGWMMAGISQRIVKGLRDTLFQKLQTLPIAYFDTHANGDMMKRSTVFPIQYGTNKLKTALAVTKIKTVHNFIFSYTKSGFNIGSMYHVTIYVFADKDHCKTYAYSFSGAAKISGQIEWSY